MRRIGRELSRALSRSGSRMTDVSCPDFDIARLRRSFVSKTLSDPHGQCWTDRIDSRQGTQCVRLNDGRLFAIAVWSAFGAHGSLDACPELALNASRRDVHFYKLGNSGLPDLR